MVRSSQRDARNGSLQRMARRCGHFGIRRHDSIICLQAKEPFQEENWLAGVEAERDKENSGDSQK